MKKKLLTALCCVIVFIACQKETPEQESKIAPEIEVKAFKFLSVVHNVDVSQIRYDDTKNFVLIGDNYKMPVEELIKRYGEANVYKAEFEKGDENEN